MHYLDSAPDSGERPAVFIHGLGASSLSLLPVATLVRLHRRVVLPDLFHFGGFSEAEGGDLDTLEHVDALGELLRSLGCGPVDLCGHSMGGGLSIYLALRAPDVVSTIALLNPGGFTHGYSELRDEILSMTQAKARRLYELAVSRTPFSHSRAAKVIGGRLLHAALATDGVRGYLRTIRDHQWLDRQVAGVQCPTLLLWGKDDRFLPPAIAEHIVAELEDVEAYWLQGCAHMVAFEAPYTVYRLLMQFWAKQGAVRQTIPPWVESVLPPPEAEAIDRESVRPPRVA